MTLLLLTVEPREVLPGAAAVLAGISGAAAHGQALPGESIVREETEQGLAVALELLRPRAAWALRLVVHGEGEAQLPARSRAEPALRWSAPAALAELAGAEKAALIALTVGPELEEEATACFRRGEYLRGLVLDVIGGIAVHRLANLVRGYVSREARAEGLSAGRPSGPGYDGWPLEDLPELVAAAGGPALGLRLTSGLMLSPQKSLCLVVPWFRTEGGVGRVAPD